MAETPVAQKIRQRAVDRRKAALSTERVHRWLISYHEQRGTLASLYNCRIGDYDVRVPVITRHEWLTSAPVRPERDPLIRFALGHEQSFPV
ncbi:hypothetical protein ACIBFB_09265 [Nocardiopsis sp. NPDC050513]|uniref:hypothetical protein n=1 Tax=Nocardiopsis sp. NPDC050513 TaxID=3364338 RepID=UPI00379FD6BF